MAEKKTSGKYAISEAITGEELKDCRKILSMTQQRLADFIGVTKKTVERWEGGAKPVRGPVVPLLRIIKERPELIRYYEIPKRTTRLRLWYMFRNEECTLIDVDEKNRKVEIRNYTDRIQYRAFGINEHPTFAQYEEFLRERCFPETRDNLKLVLKDLDIPFYDPLLIIEKTQGRMAEDDFWIRVEY